MKFLQWLFILSGGLLQLLVIGALVKRAYRAFPILFAYVIASLLATVVEVAVILDVAGWSKFTAKYYWINEAVLQFLIFFLVLSLIHRAMEANPHRAAVMRWLVFGALAFASASFLLNWDDKPNRLMTQVSRNMSFAAVLLNLVLWLMLIRHRLPDTRVLMISGGLGLQMAGEAIAHSLRQLSRRAEMIGNVTLVLSYLLCLLVWWQALRRPAPATTRSNAPRFDPASRSE
jgi:hypothetical protein